MYFDSKKGPVYAPDRPELKSFYELLQKHHETLGGSRLFEDLVDVYETLDQDLKEESA